jgi:hypothetical protein
MVDDSGGWHNTSLVGWIKFKIIDMLLILLFGKEMSLTMLLTRIIIG